MGFYSHRLAEHQERWSTFERELLAIHLAVQHFGHFLEGREFHVLTDHKPIVKSSESETIRHSTRVARSMAYVAEFTHDIRHIEGENNPVADALS